MTLSTNGADEDPNFPCGSTAQLTGSWRSYTITGITSADLSVVKDFFKATYVYEDPNGGNIAGSGGTVYFDNIQYTP